MAVNLHTTHFRFGNDDGTESTHTFKANEDTNISLIKTGIFLLRFQVQETGNTAAANTDCQFQVSRNGGAFQDITTSSTICRAVAVNAFTNGANCTKRLTGTGTFETTGAGCTEDGSSGGTANDIAALGCSETECGLQLQSGDIANGDVLTFRLTSPDFTITNDVVPTITVLHNVSLTPGNASLTLSTFAPTLTATDNQTLTPGVATLTLATFAPTVVAQDPQLVTPGIAALTLTTFAPTVTVTQNASLTPGTLALGLTTFAPTVTATAHQTLTPTTKALALETFAPTVTASDHKAVTPGAASLTLETYEPTVTVSGGDVEDVGDGGVSVTPDSATLTLQGYAPTVTCTETQVEAPRDRASSGGCSARPAAQMDGKSLHHIKQADDGPRAKLLRALQAQADRDAQDMAGLL
jgi:hypothetical protein